MRNPKFTRKGETSSSYGIASSLREHSEEESQEVQEALKEDIDSTVTKECKECTLKLNICQQI